MEENVLIIQAIKHFNNQIKCGGGQDTPEYYFNELIHHKGWGEDFSSLLGGSIIAFLDCHVKTDC